jgi:hypothetical protein
MDPLRLNDITLNLKLATDDLKQLKANLGDPTWTRERDQILPFFKSATNLSAFIGRIYCDTVNRYKHECQILNFFRADLVAGDAIDNRYLFVEFEDADPNSMFVKPRQTTRIADEWSTNLEHGYSQVIDWFWLLEDAKRLPQFDAVFGRTPAIAGLVVAGRTDVNDKDIRARIRWREEKTIINSGHIFIKSYDQLVADLQAKLDCIAIDAAQGP